MKGFLRRDLCLLRLGAWFYPVIVAVAFVVSMIFSQSGVANYTVYFLLVFGMESLYSLMTYDGMNGWLSYAAAIPGGRKKMVDARYFLALCVALVLAGLLGLYTLARGERLALWTMGFYTGAFLLILSVTQPVGFRWGYTGSGVRLAITMVTFVMLGVLGGLFSGVLQEARADLAQGTLRADVRNFFTALAGFLPLLGLGTLVLSWRLSRRIMEKKEF